MTLLSSFKAGRKEYVVFACLFLLYGTNYIEQPQMSRLSRNARADANSTHDYGVMMAMKNLALAGAGPAPCLTRTHSSQL